MKSGTDVETNQLTTITTPKEFSSTLLMLLPNFSCLLIKVLNFLPHGNSSTEDSKTSFQQVKLQTIFLLFCHMLAMVFFHSSPCSKPLKSMNIQLKIINQPSKHLIKPNQLKAKKLLKKLQNNQSLKLETFYDFQNPVNLKIFIRNFMFNE